MTFVKYSLILRVDYTFSMLVCSLPNFLMHTISDIYPFIQQRAMKIRNGWIWTSAAVIAGVLIFQHFRSQWPKELADYRDQLPDKID